MEGVPPPTAEIGCLLGSWGGAGKRSNRYNVGFMAASGSVSGCRGEFSESVYPTKTLPRSATVKLGINPHSSLIFSERELTFTFAICYHLSVCRLSVCRLSSVTLVRPTQVVQIFGNISTALGTLAIH